MAWTARTADRDITISRLPGASLHPDARHRVNLVPLAVVLLGHDGPGDRDVRADRRDHFRIVEFPARWLRIGLRDLVVADTLEYKVLVLVHRVAAVDQTGKLRIHLQPAVRIAVPFVPHAVWLMVRLRGSRVDDGARHREAVLPHEQARRVVDVLPQTVAAAGRAWCAGDAGTQI